MSHKQQKISLPQLPRIWGRGGGRKEGRRRSHLCSHPVSEGFTYAVGVLQTESLSQVNGSPTNLPQETLERQRGEEVISTCPLEHVA